MHGARTVLRATSRSVDQKTDAGLVWAFETSMSTYRDAVPLARPHLLILLISLRLFPIYED